LAGYRVTIRFGDPPVRYEMLDVDASSAREALQRAAERFPEAAEATADLIEIRLKVEREDRG
jgi:hypothetical protein